MDEEKKYILVVIQLYKRLMTYLLCFDTQVFEVPFAKESLFAYIALVQKLAVRYLVAKPNYTHRVGS